MLEEAGEISSVSYWVRWGKPGFMALVRPGYEPKHPDKIIRLKRGRASHDHAGSGDHVMTRARQLVGIAVMAWAVVAVLLLGFLVVPLILHVLGGSL